jgi:ectoine hydroxylase-related dioxygenase (phytanoyl-CoA dioxygenase family)
MPDGLYMPDAQDLDPLSITPTRSFEECNSLLGDAAAIDDFYAENGYLFFRDVLDQGSIARARDEMLEIAVDKFGLVERGDPTARWTGEPLSKEWSEEDPVFAGISRRLVEHPHNITVMGQCLGEPACIVPNVNYRLYPPGGPVTGVHQDGFYSPGIESFRPLWIPLIPMPREVGGLMVAIGQHKKGFFHNLAPGKRLRVPAGVIDERSWATIDYRPGDLLVVHPYSPHGGLPNRSDRLRVSIDVRVQSLANPTAFAGTVRAVNANSILIAADDSALGDVQLAVDEDTFIRVLSPGVREPFATFADYTRPGMHLLAVRAGDRAIMLRCGSQP